MIYANSKVRDLYTKGMSFNEALNEVFEKEITERIEKDPKFKDFTPVNMLMYDSKLTKHKTMQDMFNTATYQSGGMEDNQWLFPMWVETTLRESMQAKDIISYVCDTTVSVDGNWVSSATLDLTSDDNKNAIKKARIPEGADLPTGKIKIGEKAVSLWKSGRAIEATYEAIRRMKIDLFRKQLNAIASDVARQNLDNAAYTLVNGDGNKNASTAIDDFSGKGGLTADNLVSAMVDYFFANNFAADTLVVGKDYYKKLIAMTFDPSLSNGASGMVTFDLPQIGMQNVKILCADVPQIGSKDVALMLNRSNTLIRYEENGSNIQEYQNFAKNQTQLLTVSENSGYAINMKGSNMHIVLSA